MTDPGYRIFETDEFAKRLSKLGRSNILFIRKKLTTYIYPQLKQEPCFGNNIKKLVGYDPETWRYRIGKFRLFFAVDAKTRIVKIVTIEFRKDAY